MSMKLTIVNDYYTLHKPCDLFACPKCNTILRYVIDNDYNYICYFQMPCPKCNAALRVQLALVPIEVKVLEFEPQLSN